ISLNLALKVGLRSPAHLVFAKTLVHLHHLPAYRKLGHVALQISAVSRIDPVGRFARNQTGLHRPVHKPGPGISRPKRSVAIEDGYPRRQSMNGRMKLHCAQTADCNDMAHKMNSTFLRAQLRVRREQLPKAHYLYRTRYVIPVPTPASSGVDALKPRESDP